MRRSCLPVLTLLLLMGPSVASAGVFSAVWHEFSDNYHRSKAWPQPFVYQDNAVARAPFGAMVHNGWRLQNLIGDHLFNPDTSELNEAGDRQVRWIMTQAPANHRTVYVTDTGNPKVTSARLESVRRAARRFAIAGDPVDVRGTHLVSRGWPAEYVNAISVKFGTSTPDPRLPTESTEIAP